MQILDPAPDLFDLGGRDLHDLAAGVIRLVHQAQQLSHLRDGETEFPAAADETQSLQV
ncbi:MAG: hypothetical protein U5K33_01265 [Halofilum sp. (in: g-proteobacteria)]|nr:hypothetical protein [Halofilum sp. (in: g-proteobacteria)]